jgi:2-polyprenyl-3-methyl-5-hydroxy-6-metoxy-1,4-benzoquinol methylase
MADRSTEKKWNAIYANSDHHNEVTKHQQKTKAAFVLQEYSYLLPNSGKALDLACGLGANALFMAARGLQTHAWDISENAIQQLHAYSKEKGVSITTEVRDIEQLPPIINSFDVICVSYFLDRTLTKSIIDALKPNGLLFYQTFINEKITDNGPRNPLYRLQPNELLRLFSPLHVLVYQENGSVGDIKKGLRDTALIVAQKR